MPCRPGLSFASTPSLTVPDDYNLTIQCPGLHMPLNILGQGDHPTIGKRSHVYFIDCQVSTYRHISDAAKPITNNSDHSAAATALGLSSVLFGNSPGHAHFVRSDLLVPLEVSHPPSTVCSSTHLPERCETSPTLTSGGDSTMREAAETCAAAVSTRRSCPRVAGPTCTCTLSEATCCR